MDSNRVASSNSFKYLLALSGTYRQACRHLDQQQVVSSRRARELQAASYRCSSSRYVLCIAFIPTKTDRSAATNGFSAQQGTFTVNGHAPQAQNYASQQTVPPPSNTGATSYYGAPASIPQAAPPPPVPSVSLQNVAPPSQQSGMMQYLQPVIPTPQTQYQSNPQAPPQASEQSVPAAQPAPTAAGNSDPQQQLQLLQQLAQVLSPEQLLAVITQMGLQLPAPAAAPVTQVAQPVVNQAPQNGGYDAGQTGQNGQNGYDQTRNNQDSQSRFRDRSRSPDAKRRRVSPPNRRESPTYGVYDPNVAQNDAARRGDRGKANRGNRNDFRRRTPPGDRPASPGMVERSMQHKPPGAPKPVGHDYQIPSGRIRGTPLVSFLAVYH